MGGKEIKFGVDGRTAMLRGVDILADAVQVRILMSVLVVFGGNRRDKRLNF
jgi:hypothetical protein